MDNPDKFLEEYVGGIVVGFIRESIQLKLRIAALERQAGMREPSTVAAPAPASNQAEE